MSTPPIKLDWYTAGMDRVKWSSLLTDWQAGSGALYLRLAEAFRQAIQTGRLRPTERLPAERDLATLLSLSRSTVVAAYDDLAAGEWVTRRRGSGTHVSASAPRQAHLLALRTPVQHPFAPQGELDFTIAVPLLGEQERQEMRELVTDAFNESLYYPLGLPDLRAVLAEQYTGAGLPTTPEQIIVTSGAQQAISLIAATVLQPADTALLETPTYFGAIDVFRACRAKLVGLPVRENGIRPAEFGSLVQRHTPRLAFLTPSFQNPTGTVLPHRERIRLAEWIAQAKLPTIEDDTLCELGFEDTPPPRIACHLPDRYVINVGSLTKLYWAGLRVGWMRLPTELQPALAQAKTLADFGGSLPGQHLALRLLQDLPRLREQRRLAVQPARDLLAGLLREHLPEWTFQLPGGGQYLWVQLPTPQASSFTHHAARYGVRLFPGASMGITSMGIAAMDAEEMGTEEMPDQFLRLPFTLAPAQLPEAVARLKAAWNDFRQRPGQERLA